MPASMKNAESPDAYIAGLTGWQRERAALLRQAVKSAAELDERVKWGHLVYRAGGPVCLIRVESHRVLFGFWRGKRLRHIEPRLKPGGKYEMATLELNETAPVDPRTVTALVTEAVALDTALGDPTVLPPKPQATSAPRPSRTAHPRR